MPNVCVCFRVCAISHKIFKHCKFLERLLYCYEHTAGTLLLCSNIRASNFEIKCKLERTFFFPVFHGYQSFVWWQFQPAVLYWRRNSLRESVTVSARSCWIYEWSLQFFAQKSAAQYQNVLLLGLPTSLHTTIQTASKMKLFCCYVGKMIKTYDIMTELTHAHTWQTASGSFSVTAKAKTVRFGLNLNVDTMYLEKLTRKECSAGTRR